MTIKLEDFPQQFKKNTKDANSEENGNSENNAERKRHKYDPLIIYRNEYVDPDYVDRTPGKEKIKDEHIHYVCKFLRESFKEGDILNLGGGFPAYYHALLASDKLRNYTVVDMSPLNLKLAKELLEGSLGIGRQEIAGKIDFETLRAVANAFSRDPEYHFKISGRQMLENVYAASFRDGKWDIIEADMIERMEQLGSGELVGGRKYDNIMLTFALYTRTREELLNFLRNVRKRLKNNGRLIVMEYEDYPGIDMESEQDLLYEDIEVEKKYGDAYPFSMEDLKNILQESGYKIKHFGKVGDPSYEDGLGVYSTIIAEN